MKSEKINLESFNLIGISTRTSNAKEFDPATAQIGEMYQTYFGQQIAEKFKHRSTPGITYVVYTDFANKEKGEDGEYTFFIGEKVDSFQDQADYAHLEIPTSTYAKFTTESGKMPDVVINAWQEIWAMKPQDFGGNRRYIADFEVYDQRAADPTNSTLDIYIGIQ